MSRAGGADDEDGLVCYTVRPLRMDDADELGALHVQVWREAYAGIMPPASLDALDPAARAATWRVLAAEEAEGVAGEQGKTTRVAVHPDGGLTGFATVAPARDNEPPLPLELWALNVLAAFHGTGAAGQLLAATLGDRSAYLWVLEGNERAIAFYRKHGFALDGARKHDKRHGVDDLRMVR